jgi:hypothetical protein
MLDASGLFDAPVDISTPSTMKGLVSGDLNGDGLTDIVAAQGDGIRIMLNVAGSFTSGTLIANDPGFANVALGDLDGDGDLDVAAVTTSGADLIRFMNDGAGGFTQAGTTTIDGLPTNLDIADLDGDGDLDIVTTSLQGTGVNIVYNESGVFADSVDISDKFSGGTFPVDVIVADVKGDATPELLVLSLGADSVTILERLVIPDGQYASAGTFTTGPQPMAFEAADLNDDGRIDLVIGTQGGEGLSVLLADGDGSFATKVDYTTAEGIQALSLGDIDDDGDIDIVAGEDTGPRLSILQNDGAGAFGAPTRISAGHEPDAVILADVTGTAFADIIVGSEDTVTILASTLVPPPDAPTGIDLDAAADTGSSDADNITRLNNGAGSELMFTVSGVTIGATVRVMSGDVVLGESVAADTTVIVTGNGTAIVDGSFTIVATQDVGGRVSDASPTLNVTIDTAAPVFSTTPGTDAVTGQAYAYDAETDDESVGEATYGLTGPPAGMAIDTTTGEITWTPASNQAGDNAIVLTATDVAGNVETQLFTITVENPPDPLTGVDLIDAADSGTSTTDNITRFNNASGALLRFDVTGAEIGATVRVYADGTLIAEAVAAAASFTITGNSTTLPDGTYAVTATQTVEGRTSEAFSASDLVVDTAGPTVTSTPITTIESDTPYIYDINTNEDGDGVMFAVVTAPDDLVLLEDTGVINWFPALADVGDQTVTIAATDVAGNQTNHSFVVTVTSGAPRPDVTAAMDLSRVPATLIPGDKVRVKVMVGNAGDWIAEGVLAIRLYASTDTVLDGGDVVLGEITGKSTKVKVGQTKNFNLKFVMPADLALGTYTLIGEADTSQIANERRVANDIDRSDTTYDFAWQFGSFDGRNNVKLTVPNAAGVPVTFRMNGGGFGAITGGSSFTTITLSGTSASSKFDVKSQGNDPITLFDVTADGPLNSFKARSARVDGTVDINGAVNQIQWRAFGGTLIASGLSNYKLSGDSFGDYDIGVGGLGKSTISGNMTAGTFAVAGGETSNFTVKGTVGSGASLDLAAVRSLKINGSLLGDTTLIRAQNVKINQQWSGILTATATTDMAIKSLNVKGHTSDATLSVMAEVSKAVFTTVEDLNIYGGVDTTALDELGDLPDAFTSDVRFAKLQIKGETDNATIATSRIDNLMLSDIDTSGGLALAASGIGQTKMRIAGDSLTFKGDEIFEQTPAVPYLEVVRIT